jgi:hypothetical protein
VTIGGTQIGFYNVAPAHLAALAGAQRLTDHQVLRDGRVRLTNDTVTAEWVIEGHAVQGLSIATMMQNIKQDIANLIGLRQQVRGTIVALQGQHAGDTILIKPGAGDLRALGPEGLFEYDPGVAVNGSAQLTVQYENLQTITRICKVNASRFLPGTKIAAGDEAAVASDTLSLAQKAQYNIGQSGFASAETLLQALTNLAQPVVGAGVGGGGGTLTKAQIGLVMLMVVNDAMASCMRRYAADIGETDDKNIQRFFPKSERQVYVNAVARTNVPGATLGALRAELNRTAAAVAQLVWNSCDPYALHLAGATQEHLAGGGDPAVAAGWAAIQGRGVRGQQIPGFEKDRVKNAALGLHGATLQTWIGRAALAYTDATGAATDHYDVHGNGNVIASLQFTPVAGVGRGAVYELRDNEVAMAIGQTDAVTDTLTTLFNAA